MQDKKTVGPDELDAMGPGDPKTDKGMGKHPDKGKPREGDGDAQTT